MENPFANLGLDDELVKALIALGYEEPTPIQSQALPLLLAGRDVLGQAATGTGSEGFVGDEGPRVGQSEFTVMAP